MTFSYLSVCSGLGGCSLALKPLGATPVGFAEIEPFPSAILADRYPDVTNFGDFTRIPMEKLGRVDVLIGGTPCQAFSLAGKRLSLDDARGNLSLSYVVLAHELARSYGLRNCIWENVPGVLSTKDNAFGCFMGALVGADDSILPCEQPRRGKSNKFWKWREAGRWPVLDDDGAETGEYVERAEGHICRWPAAGMASGPRARLCWRVLDAQHFGVPQRRRRVFVVADFGNGADPAAVLFEPESVRGDTSPSRKKRESIAPTISARTKGGGGLGADFDCDGGLIASTGDISHCLNAGGMGRQDYETETLIAHALRGEGFDASEYGTGRGTPIVPVAIQGNMIGRCETAGPQGSGFDDSGAMFTLTKTDVHAVAFDLRGRDGGAQFEGPHDTANIRAASGGSSRSYVAFAQNSRDEVRIQGDGDICGALSAEPGMKQQTYLAMPLAVRRLTPMECERLQGMPDDWTKIPWRGKPANQCPDGPRYKAIGNSWAIPVVNWIGRRLLENMPK